MHKQISDVYYRFGTYHLMEVGIYICATLCYQITV